MNSTRNVKSRPERDRGKVISIRDARARRVQALKALVRSGRYAPNLEGLADALIARGVVSPAAYLDSTIDAAPAELPN